MNVSLTPELERLVSRRVASGRYGSASEVVREALRLLEERERFRQARLEQLRRDVSAGLRALDRGEHILFDEKAAGAIKREGRRRLARRSPRS
jgi:antitoxin ParD1/3/4